MASLRLDYPIVCSIEYKFTDGRFHSRMLGIAFNKTDRQRYYDKAKNLGRDSYNWKTVKSVFTCKPLLPEENKK